MPGLGKALSTVMKIGSPLLLSNRGRFS